MKLKQKRLEALDMDINKLRQEAYCYDTDNYGLDIEPKEQDDDLSWLDDLFDEEATA
jgi:hypothetical protein